MTAKVITGQQLLQVDKILFSHPSSVRSSETLMSMLFEQYFLDILFHLA